MPSENEKKLRHYCIIMNLQPLPKSPNKTVTPAVQQQQLQVARYNGIDVTMSTGSNLWFRTDNTAGCESFYWYCCFIDARRLDIVPGVLAGPNIYIYERFATQTTNNPKWEWYSRLLSAWLFIPKHKTGHCRLSYKYTIIVFFSPYFLFRGKWNWVRDRVAQVPKNTIPVWCVFHFIPSTPDFHINLDKKIIYIPVLLKIKRKWWKCGARGRVRGEDDA